MKRRSIPVLDLFAGPGGLSEGFASYRGDANRRFRIALSIEKDPLARETLRLRAFFRQFLEGAPAAYYRHLRGALHRSELFEMYPREAVASAREAWLAELGIVQPRVVDSRVREALGNASEWVLIGGPPCQAYSIVGRSRMRTMSRHAFERDPRHFLYREYLRIVAVHRPPVFVFENVKGLLSSTVGGVGMFEQILADLEDPAKATDARRANGLRYRLYALSESASSQLWMNDLAESRAASHFVVRCEQHGLPQARHRIIILGVRADVLATPAMLRVVSPASARSVLADLPPLRSRLSRESDSAASWAAIVRYMLDEIDLAPELLRRKAGTNTSVRQLEKLGVGGEFVAGDPHPAFAPEWYCDASLGGFCNHSSRSHIRADIERYVFAAAFAAQTESRRSPVIADFPAWLRPNHRNVLAAMGGDMFADRFRVQLPDIPSTTITSHIAKDGHYYIHYDPLQARSLTVREAARLQTFPDNFFFCGPRTSQYQQVGNAVPPLLAHQIADIVYRLID